jgi:hypothetical protein
MEKKLRFEKGKYTETVTYKDKKHRDKLMYKYVVLRGFTYIENPLVEPKDKKNYPF